ncbi:MAG: response regulator [Kofleriaceae bacterium]
MAAVLLVDDDPMVLNGFRRVLSRQGYQVDIAETCQVGLDLASLIEYDVIIVDKNIAGMDGLDMLEHLRDRHPKAARILLTGES